MAFVYRDPFLALQQELERMLGSAFRGTPAAVSGVYPAVDVFDAGEAYVVKAELPGVTAGDIELEVEDDTLTLRGERKFAEPGEKAAYHRRERQGGRFRRVVRMPGRLDADGARADHRNGVLTVHVPKAKEARPRRLDIRAA